VGAHHRQATLGELQRHAGAAARLVELSVKGQIAFEPNYLSRLVLCWFGLVGHNPKLDCPEPPMQAGMRVTSWEQGYTLGAAMPVVAVIMLSCAPPCHPVH
jgi:hypothetical protein